jgi:flagellar hook-associated protein 3 FlgL
MRVSFAMRYSNMVRQMGQKQADLSRLSDTLSSGVRVQRPSDDPTAWSEASSVSESLRQLDTYKNNIDFATGWNNQTDSALTQLNDLITQARDLGIRAVSASSEEGASSLNQLIDEAAQLANQDYNGRYLFGGDSTTQSTSQPFTVTRDSDGVLTAVSNFQSYNASDAWQTTVRVGKNTTQTVNLDGRTVFLDDPGADSTGGAPDNNILQHLVTLRDAMQAGDTDAIQTQLTALETAQNRVLSQNSLVGSRLNGLERRSNLLDSLNIDQQDRLSDLKDADIAETVTQLQLKQTALQAAYQTATLLNGMNLQDYL